MKATLYFYECEHNGDLDEYISDIVKSGGKILDKKINYEAETARVDVEIDETFAEKFRTTRAFGFSNLDN